MEEPRTPAREIRCLSVLPIHMNDAELDQLFASCIPRLQRTARLMLRDPKDSEDAVQEGLLLAFRNLRQFQGRSSFSTWLHSILRNVARTHYRRMKCRPKCSLEEELSNENQSKFERDFVDPGPTPEQECELGERSRLLREVVQELPSRYAFAMQLCDVEGLEPRDASQILGISSCALKTCLFRARRIAARRIRARFCPPIQGMPINANSGYHPNLGSPLRMV
jgi:RNA polymerase sigma-70 factor, ECF subfamily